MNLWIGAERLAELVPYGAAVEAIRDTLRSFDPAADPPRTRVDLTAGEYLLMPAELAGYAGVKVATVTPRNPEHGLPRIQAVYLLHDATTHTLLATLDGTALTTLRTPAVSVGVLKAVLEQRFGGGADVLVYGGGPQALGHLLALAAVVPVRSAVFAVRDPARHAGLAAAAGHAAEVVSADRADPGAADVVVAATTARTPLFDGARVAERAVLMAVGSHEPDARELDGPLLGRSTVVVETQAVAMRECGDVVLAVGEGHLDPADLVPADRFVAGVPPAAGPVIFKSAGMSWEDLAVAALAHRRHT